MSGNEFFMIWECMVLILKIFIFIFTWRYVLYESNYVCAIKNSNRHIDLQAGLHEIEKRYAT
jgi:hypothetical protein